MSNKLLETSLKIARERILLKKENTQLYPQWSLREALLCGALPNGYVIRKVDVWRKLDDSGVLVVEPEHVGSQVWISTNNKSEEITIQIQRKEE